MRILVFGQTGQVATELARRLPAGVTARFLGRDRADLSDPAACAAQVGDCDAVINAAAWTAVDRAETEEAAATVVNGEAPAAIARACAAKGLPFLHISTDYVFDGAGDRPFRPDDPTDPLGAYGRSKLAGEIGVLYFTFAQKMYRFQMFAAIGAMIIYPIIAPHKMPAIVRSAGKGWRMGKQAEHLLGIEFERHWNTPIKDIRAMAKLTV